MKTNTARDLLLLAAVAFQNKQYSEAGALFATSLSSEDAPALLETLTGLPFGEEEATASSTEPRMSLRDISQALSAAIEDTVDEDKQRPNNDGIAVASDDDEDEESESEDEEDLEEDEESEDEDEEEEDLEEDEDDEEESDDVDPDMGGEKILPSSISSDTSPATVKRKDGASKLIISGVGVNSPIKLKQ